MNASDSDNASCEEHRPKKRSLVWTFFEKISRQRVQCLLCKHEQNYQGTTGNILRHLKARHDLDATIKGQQDPQIQERIKELMAMISSGPTANTIDQKTIKIQKKSSNSESSDAADPCSVDDDKQMSIGYGNIFYEELHEDCNYSDKKKKVDHKSVRRTQLEEDRILAETQYFREKAAYFRIQKHLSALQAKKVKLEIDQIVSNNKNET